MRPQSKSKRPASPLVPRPHKASPPPRAGKARWRRRKDARPQEILEAALSVFADKGFAAARMDEIAERARVSKGTIYLYFESKEAVFRALIQETLVKRVSDMAALIRDYRGPVAPLLREMLLRFGHFVSTSDLVVLPKMVIAEAGNFPDLARIYREEVVERGLTLFGGLLQSGMDRGEFRKVPVQHAVRLCFAPLLLAAMWRTTFAPLDREPYDYAGLMDAHVTTLLRGLQPKERAQ
jgi:AcrR family transcriptional regulator